MFIKYNDIIQVMENVCIFGNIYFKIHIISVLENADL